MDVHGTVDAGEVGVDEIEAFSTCVEGGRGGRSSLAIFGALYDLRLPAFLQHRTQLFCGGRAELCRETDSTCS